MTKYLAGVVNAFKPKVKSNPENSHGSVSTEAASILTGNHYASTFELPQKQNLQPQLPDMVSHLQTALSPDVTDSLKDKFFNLDLEFNELQNIAKALKKDLGAQIRSIYNVYSQNILKAMDNIRKPLLLEQFVTSLTNLINMARNTALSPKTLSSIVKSSAYESFFQALNLNSTAERDFFILGLCILDIDPESPESCTKANFILSKFPNILKAGSVIAPAAYAAAVNGITAFSLFNPITLAFSGLYLLNKIYKSYSKSRRATPPTHLDKLNSLVEKGLSKEMANSIIVTKAKNLGERGKGKILKTINIYPNGEKIASYHLTTANPNEKIPYGIPYQVTKNIHEKSVTVKIPLGDGGNGIVYPKGNNNLVKKVPLNQDISQVSNYNEHESKQLINKSYSLYLKTYFGLLTDKVVVPIFYNPDYTIPRTFLEIASKKDNFEDLLIHIKEHEKFIAKVYKSYSLNPYKNLLLKKCKCKSISLDIYKFFLVDFLNGRIDIKQTYQMMQKDYPGEDLGKILANYIEDTAVLAKYFQENSLHKEVQVKAGYKNLANITQEEAKNLITNIEALKSGFETLKGLYKLGIVYTDIKLENIMINETGELKFIDIDLDQDLRTLNTTGGYAPANPRLTQKINSLKHNQEVINFKFNCSILAYIITCLYIEAVANNQKQYFKELLKVREITFSGRASSRRPLQLELIRNEMGIEDLMSSLIPCPKRKEQFAKIFGETPFSQILEFVKEMDKLNIDKTPSFIM